MELSILAFEICTRFDPTARLHTELRRLLTTHPVNATYQDKWNFYRAVVSELNLALPWFERGCWDYYDDDRRARDDYDQWVSGMVTEEGARTTESGDDPYRGEPRYMTFTMAFLIEQGSTSDASLKAACEIPDKSLWRRDSFSRVLGGIGQMSFASVQSDCAYIIPRDAGWGLTAQDLTTPKFHYLRPIE
jgi:hypothetical protein